MIEISENDLIKWELSENDRTKWELSENEVRNRWEWGENDWIKIEMMSENDSIKWEWLNELRMIELGFYWLKNWLISDWIEWIVTLLGWAVAGRMKGFSFFVVDWNVKGHLLADWCSLNWLRKTAKLRGPPTSAQLVHPLPAR